MPKKRQQMSWLQTNTVRIARVHFILVLMFAASVIAYDAWKLITNQSLIERWTVAATTLAVTTIVWFIARNTTLSANVYKSLLSILIIMDIAIAGFYIYAGRGMSSRAVVLFAIPIIISAITLSRSAIYATASLSTAVYTYSALKYFTDYPSEGYKVELYGDLFFYSSLFFVLATFLWILVRSVQAKSS